MQHYTVLIVEDNLIIANSMCSILKKEGYTVLKIARSSGEALALVKENEPDIILMDISLKDSIDGVSTSKIINRHYNIPIIFITQHTDRDIFLNARETAPRNYITKPFTSEVLLRALELGLADNVLSKNKDKVDIIDNNTVDGVFIYTKENTYEKLLFTDLLYIESVGAYSRIYFERNGTPVDNPYIVSISSNHVVSQMEYPGLIKIHRSYYVNIKKINKIDSNHVYINDVRLPISEKIKPDFFNKKFNILRKPS